MHSIYRLLVAVPLGAVGTPAMACVPPPPSIQLNGESDEAYRLRNERWVRAVDDEDRRAWQVGLYEEASRVSLARVTDAQAVPNRMSDGSYSGRKVIVYPVAAFKGSPTGMRPVTLQDAGVSSCGRYGGGSATAAAVGDYVLLFENIQVEGVAAPLGLLLKDVREPHVLNAFSNVVQAARSAAPAPRPGQ